MFNSLHDKHYFKLLSMLTSVLILSMCLRQVIFICCEIRHSVPAIQALKDRDRGNRIAAYQSENVVKEAAA